MRSPYSRLNPHHIVTLPLQEALQYYDTPRNIKEALDTSTTGPSINPYGNYDVPHQGLQPIPVVKKSCGCIMKLMPTVSLKGFLLSSVILTFLGTLVKNISICGIETYQTLMPYHILPGQLASTAQTLPRVSLIQALQ